MVCNIIEDPERCHRERVDRQRIASLHPQADRLIKLPSRGIDLADLGNRLVGLHPRAQNSSTATRSPKSTGRQSTIQTRCRQSSRPTMRPIVPLPSIVIFIQSQPLGVLDNRALLPFEKWTRKPLSLPSSS